MRVAIKTIGFTMEHKLEFHFYEFIMPWLRFHNT